MALSAVGRCTGAGGTGEGESEERRREETSGDGIAAGDFVLWRSGMIFA
jgi:hypothetical protein